MNDRPFAITLEVGTSLLNRTGTWRTGQRPAYVNLLPPCNDACPAGENVQRWLWHAEEGDYESAWRRIMDDNPFPGLMGRICYHPCEGACNRGSIDASVGINGVERFLGDQAIRHGWAMPAGAPTGKRVMIVGAGPAGLSAAYQLARFGHAVTVYEAEAKAGGILRYAIPKYRLPRERLNAEIERIEGMGVAVETRAAVDDVIRARSEGRFDAVFLAVGAPVSAREGLPAAQRLPFLDALQVLRAIEEDRPTGMRGHVVVYGGGNTAIDVARCAIRLGALKATVIYRRSREHMSAHDVEVRAALEEGVELLYRRTIRSVEGRTLKLEVMTPGMGRDVHPSGHFETLEFDVGVDALGQLIDTKLLSRIPGIAVEDMVVLVGPDMQTGAAGVFAGGDVVPSKRTATHAIGHGKKAARHIDAYLRGTTYGRPPRPAVVTPDQLNAWYYTDAPRVMQPILDALRRQSGFSEVVGDLTPEQAAFEARRCLSCGNCLECDNCYGVCPDNAILKLGPGKGFAFKYEYCKGCGLCEHECPCHAIAIVPEQG